MKTLFKRANGGVEKLARDCAGQSAKVRKTLLDLQQLIHVPFKTKSKLGIADLKYECPPEQQQPDAPQDIQSLIDMNNAKLTENDTLHALRLYIDRINQREGELGEFAAALKSRNNIYSCGSYFVCFLLFY